MRMLFLLLTGIAAMGFAACEAAAQNNTASIGSSAVYAAESEDVSSTYTYTAQDVCNLQDFILGKPVEEDLNGKPYDMNGDERWDVFDLCLMRRKLAEDTKLKISVNGTELTAELADSTAARELAEKLKAEPVSVALNEYGGFEKVGKLPWALTKSDERIVTEAGDIMLYQGDQMTIFYGSNTWSYTKLGHIDNITGEELADLLGEGNITVTLSY